MSITTPHIRTIDPKKANHYHRSADFWKKQGFIFIQTRYGNSQTLPQISKIFGYHNISGLHYIFNESAGYWEVWGPKNAIALLTQKTQTPEQRRIQEIQDSIKDVISRVDIPVASGWSGTIIW